MVFSAISPRHLRRSGRLILAIALLFLVLGLQSGHQQQPVHAASLNNTMVYWLNGGDSTLKRITSSGSGITALPTVAPDYRGLATDDTYLYFSTSTNKIQRVPLAGGSPTDVATLSATTGNLSIQGNYVYFSTWSGGVYRTLKDGTGTPSQLVTTAAKSAAEPNNASTGFSGVVATASYLYFTTYGASGGTWSSLFRSNLDGTSVTRLYADGAAATPSLKVNDFVVTASKIYLPSSSGYTGIVSMNLDGSSPSATFRSGTNFRSIEGSGDYMYFTDGNANIGRFPLADNLVSITSLVTSPNASSAWDIALIDMPSVTYANGGALTGSVPTDSSSPYSLGSTVTVLGNTGTLARPGYTFSGWQLNMGGVLSTPAIGTTFTVTTDATLTAQWTVVTTTTAATTTTLAPTTTTIAPTQNVAQIVTTTTSTLPTSATTTVPSGAQSNTDSSTPMPTTGSDMLRFIPLSIAMAALGAWLVRRSQMNSLQ